LLSRSEKIEIAFNVSRPLPLSKVSLVVPLYRSPTYFLSVSLIVCLMSKAVGEISLRRLKAVDVKLRSASLQGLWPYDKAANVTALVGELS
ncbi:hypothetical protein Tco_1148469, partial [Tanacetum coccineum]